MLDPTIELTTRYRKYVDCPYTNEDFDGVSTVRKIIRAIKS